MQGADDADNDLLHAAAQLLENLNSAFLGNLGHSLDKLLALHGVYLRNAVEVLRRKGGDAAVLKFAAGRDQCVANGKNTWVKNANDIACISLVDNFTLLGHQLLRLGKLDLFPPLHMVNLHALLKFTGADAHKSNAVPVRLVHVGLNLKDKGGELRAEGVDLTLVRGSR